MEIVPTKQTDADDYDARLDHLVDTRGVSYDDARRELGPPPYELYEVPERVAVTVTTRALKTTSIRRRRRSGHGPQYGEEEGVGYLGGVPPYYQPHVPLSSEQAELNTHWIDKIRHNLSHLGDDSDLKQ